MAEALRRTLGFGHVYALGVGGVIGMGIFFLPGKAAALLGPASGVAFLLAGALALVVAMCFAEAASRFSGTGGAMVYSREAFGDVAGFGVGWATWFGRVASWAALANAFVLALTPLLPEIHELRGAVVLALIGALTVLNLRGVAFGAGANTALLVAKLLPLAVFVGIGAFHVAGERFTPFAPHGYGRLGETTLLVFYAYVGFEGMVIPAAEMKDPERTVPRALLASMATVIAVYAGIWWVCAGTLSDLAGADNPVGDAAATFLGPAATTFVQVGILLSLLGINAFMALVTPRALYALGRQALLPAWFARTGGRGAVPVVAILTTGACTAALALSGRFEALAVVSVLARLAQYVPTCLAVLRLRRRGDVAPATFRVPLGPVLPIVAVAVCVWLGVEARPAELRGGALAIAAGLPLFVLARWRAVTAGAARPSEVP